MKSNKTNILEQLDIVLKERKKEDSSKSYVSSLYSKGNEAINNKIIEECNEYIESTSNNDRKHMIHEATDLWFHTLILLSNENIKLEEIISELESRFGTSGHLEKASRSSSEEEK